MPWLPGVRGGRKGSSMEPRGRVWFLLFLTDCLCIMHELSVSGIRRQISKSTCGVTGMNRQIGEDVDVGPEVQWVCKQLTKPNKQCE